MSDNPPEWEAVDEESTANVEVQHEYEIEGGSSSNPPDASEEVPPTTSAPEPDTTHPRGTLVFERDRTDLIQKIEMRGNNGVTDVPDNVETMYLLTGANYTTPTDLIQLDHHELYEEVTETKVEYNATAIAEYVAERHEGVTTPSVIVSVHTHPSGSTFPSSGDRKNPKALRDELGRYFDDFEFFQGIHGLGDEHVPSAEQLRKLHAGKGHVWWYGENRKHELALFDPHYNPCEVIVE